MMNTLALLLIVQYMYGCTFWDDNLFNQMAVVGPMSASRKPWPAGQIWPADLIHLARVGMLWKLIFRVMNTK